MHAITSESLEPLESPRRLFARLGALAVAVTFGAVALLLATPAVPAFAHDQLIGTQFTTAESGETTGFTLAYSDNVLQVGTDIAVTDANGESVVSGDPKFAGREVAQALVSPLADGRYSAVWRVVSSDGHPIQGGFAFDVTDGVAGELLPLEAADSSTNAAAEDGTEAADAADGNAAADQSDAGQSADEPSFAVFLPYLGAGVALAAVVVIAAVMMRARKNAAERDASQQSRT